MLRNRSSQHDMRNLGSRAPPNMVQKTPRNVSDIGIRTCAGPISRVGSKAGIPVPGFGMPTQSLAVA